MNKGYKIMELPIYNEGHIGERDMISRQVNFKGELTTLAITEMNYIAIINLLVSKEPRGNHYHLIKSEYLYIQKGKARFYLKNNNDNSRKIQVVEVKEGSLIFIEPNVSHAVEVIEEGFMIEFSPTKFDLFKNDTYKDEITK